MALSKDIVETVRYVNLRDESDFIEKEQAHNSAYIVVDRTGGTKSMQTCIVCAYKDSAKTDVIWRKEYKFAPSVGKGSDNFIAQAYRHLKSLPEYANAEDC